MSSEDKIDSNVFFEYFFSHKEPYLVVTFVGPIGIQAIEKLNQCREELKKFEGLRRAVLYFRDVSQISGDAIAILTQIQLDIRAKPCELRISSLAPSVKEKLQKMGVIRTPELVNNLPEALKDMT